MDPAFLKGVNDRLAHLRGLERELRHGALVGPLLSRAEDDATWRGLLRVAFTGWLQALNGYVRHHLPDGIASVIASIQVWVNEQEAARLSGLAGAAAWQEPPPAAPRPVGWAMPPPPPFAMNLYGAQGEIWIDPDQLDRLANNLGQVADGVDTFGRSVRDAIEPLRLPAGPPYASPMSGAGGGMPVDAGTAVGWPVAYQAVSRDLRAALVDLVDRAAQVRRANAIGDGPPGILLPPAGPPAPSQAAAMAQAATACLADRATGPGRQPNQAKEAEPVSVSTGNYLLETLDVVVSGGAGDGVLFGRTYNSLDADRSGNLGFGWSHTFDIYLTPNSSGVTIRYGDGHEDDLPAGSPRLRTLADGYELTALTRNVWLFDRDGRLTSLADPSSNRWTLRYTDGGALAAVLDPAHRELRFDTDDDGRVIAVTDALDRTSRYEYDASGDLVAAADPAGGVWRYAYDTAHHLTTVTDPDGGLVVENVYDTTGRVIDQFDSAGARWSYRYEADRTVTTDPLGRNRIYGVDVRFRTTSLTDPSGAATRFTWDDGSRLVEVVDAERRAWRFTYEEAGSVTRAVGPDDATVDYEFDDREDLVAVIGADGSRLTLRYDDAGRPITVTSPGGATTTLQWRPDGLPVSVTDGLGATEHLLYEPDGRLAGLVDPLGATTRIATDVGGQILSEVHPDGASTSFEWDPVGRLTGVTDPLGAQWRYAYDGAGRLTAVSNALGRTTRYAWDARGLLVSVTDPRERTTSFDYDLARRLVGKVDARGVRVAYTWDAADRLTAVEPEDGPALRFSYDAVGQILTMTDATGTTTFSHDLAGRPIREEHDRSGAALVHDYDGMGRRRRVHLERHGQEVAVWAYDYDTEGRVATVTDPAGGRTTLTCDAAGQLVGVRHPNGVVSAWQHDAAGQVVELTHGAPGGDPFGGWSFRYDSEGNRIGAGPVEYAYDDLDRLASVTDHGGRSIHFAYDPLGNRTAVGDLTFTYDDAGQVLSDGAYAYEHDAAGNLVSRRPLAGGPGGLAFSWDGLGRLLTIDVDGESTAFDYDALGRRTVRRDRSGETRRIFDGANVLEERRGGDVVFETVAGLTVLNRINAEGVTEYLHPDGNANVVWITNSTGHPSPGPTLGPWGERLNGRQAQGVDGFAGTIGVRAGVGGLWEMRARFYDPHLGRFLSPDPWPATLPGPATLNRYAYALNDPISLLDPSGLFCWTGKNAEGKCRGVRDVAKRVAKPLEMVSTVATAVAVTAVGLSVVCPPCALAALPIAGSLETIATVSRGVAFGAGLTSTLIECSERIVSFDCGTGVVMTAVGVGVGGQIERGLSGLASSRMMVASPEKIGQFGAGIFDIFSEGISGAIEGVRK